MKPSESHTYLGIIQNSFEYPDLPIEDFVGNAHNLDVTRLYLGVLLLYCQPR